MNPAVNNRRRNCLGNTFKYIRPEFFFLENLKCLGTGKQEVSEASSRLLGQWQMLTTFPTPDIHFLNYTSTSDFLRDIFSSMFTATTKSLQYHTTHSLRREIQNSGTRTMLLKVQKGFKFNCSEMATTLILYFQILLRAFRIRVNVQQEKSPTSAPRATNRGQYRLMKKM